jgi:hypothetical protein
VHTQLVPVPKSLGSALVQQGLRSGHTGRLVVFVGQSKVVLSTSNAADAHSYQQHRVSVWAYKTQRRNSQPSPLPVDGPQHSTSGAQHASIKCTAASVSM